MLSEKQKNILEEYLSVEYIRKVNSFDHDRTNKFIGMVLETHKYIWQLLLKSSRQNKITNKQWHVLAKEFEIHKKELKAVKDEPAYVIKEYQFKNYPKKIYYITQQWFKGMSNSPTEEHYWVNEDFIPHIHPFEMLIDMEVYSIYGLLQYFTEPFPDSAVQKA